MTENEIGSLIIKHAIEIHRELGPGLLERVYEVVLERELISAGLQVERQVPISIHYKDLTFDEGFRADLIVERKVLVELKAVEALSKAHAKQVLTYLRLTNLKLGYLLNFNTETMKEGIKRIAHNL